ncbi:MAG: hypothetical protein IJ710_01430 [Prevotella sp.]|nr:hypothetical protein [Prevotella sp.]
MLGIDNKETPVVTGAYADEIREAARRAYQGLKNESDKNIADRSARILQEYNAVWK